MELKEFREMNVIPLVDVMLVLLTIVLTTATFIAAGEISINLPEAKRGDTLSENPLFITLMKDGRVFVNKEEIPLNGLMNVFQGLKREQPIVIRADKEVYIERFVFLLDTLKGEGFKKVSVEVQQK